MNGTSSHSYSIHSLSSVSSAYDGHCIPDNSRFSSWSVCGQYSCPFSSGGSWSALFSPSLGAAPAGLMALLPEAVGPDWYRIGGNVNDAVGRSCGCSCRVASRASMRCCRDCSSRMERFMRSIEAYICFIATFIWLLAWLSCSWREKTS